MGAWELGFFDPEAECLVVDRRLPHWAQAGTLCFITFRTQDSLPKETLDRFFAQRRDWLARHGIDAQSPAWRDQLKQLSGSLQVEFHRAFFNRWHDSLDEGHGDCLLADLGNARIVTDSLLHFDADRYAMFDFVVMPNHVHLIAAFFDEQAMLAQCKSWKHFTARKINRSTGGSGRFWQQDGFDHLIRSEAQFELLCRYIAENPKKAGLRPNQFHLYQSSHHAPP